MNFAGGGMPEQFRASQVSRDYFRLFGVPIIRGRAISADEDLPERRRRSPLLSERLWAAALRQRSDDARPIDFAQRRAPHRHRHRRRRLRRQRVRAAPEVWVPFQLDPNTSDQGHYFQVAGSSRRACRSSRPRRA